MSVAVISSTDESPCPPQHQRVVEAFYSTTYYTVLRASLAVFLLTLDVPGKEGEEINKH
jgi:hypothetical protein